MMSTLLTCPQTHYKTPGEVRGVAIDARGKLREGEILTGTPTITVSGSDTVLTITSPAVSTSILVINGESVEAGKAITCTALSGTDGVTYAIKASCSTSQSQTVQPLCTLVVSST